MKSNHLVVRNVVGLAWVGLTVAFWVFLIVVIVDWRINRKLKAMGHDVEERRPPPLR